MLIASHNNSEADEQLQMDEYDMANSFNSDKVSVHTAVDDDENADNVSVHTAVEKEGSVEYEDFDFEDMCHQIRKERRRIKKIVEHNCTEFAKESQRLTHYNRIIIALVTALFCVTVATAYYNTQAVNTLLEKVKSLEYEDEAADVENAKVRIRGSKIRIFLTMRDLEATEQLQRHADRRITEPLGRAPKVVDIKEEDGSNFIVDLFFQCVIQVVRWAIITCILCGIAAAYISYGAFARGTCHGVSIQRETVSVKNIPYVSISLGNGRIVLPLPYYKQ